MNQLKRAQVIMLPRDMLLEATDELDFASGLGIKAYTKRGDFKGNVSLYIVTDDEIKEGDWKYCLNKQMIGQSMVNSIHTKKIIATTDTSLTKEIRVLCKSCKGSGIRLEKESLPQPSKEFIQKYIESFEANPITDVLVEYDEHRSKQGDFEGSFLKVCPKDNTITIRKNKDNFSLQEMKHNLRTVMSLKINDPWFNLENWINTHL